MVLVNGQWQGGGDPVTCAAAEELRRTYLPGKAVERVEIDQPPLPEKRHSVRGYDAILRQTERSWALLRQRQPDRLFTLGGGCDADVASIAYLNEQARGDLTVFWFDAHGDLNAPEESASGLFYGMPARVLMQPQDGFLPLVPAPVKTENWMLLGGRDLDPPETAFLQKHAIACCPPGGGREEWTRFLRQHRGKRAYIHFDLDVLDPAEFSATPLPVAGGLSVEETFSMLRQIRQEMDLVGFGLFEYTGGAGKNAVLEAAVAFGEAMEK